MRTLIDRLNRRGFEAVTSRRNRLLDGGVPWIALVVLLRWRADGGRRLDVPRSSGAIGAGWAAAQLVKHAYHRVRPCQGSESIALIGRPDGSSLPSDQAAAAFAGAAAIADALPRLRPYVYAAASLTAVSRVYAGVHYPSDVAAGALLGHVVGRAVKRSTRRVVSP